MFFIKILSNIQAVCPSCIVGVGENAVSILKSLLNGFNKNPFLKLIMKVMTYSFLSNLEYKSAALHPDYMKNLDT